MQDSVTIDLGGRLLTIETGKLAKQADGAAVVRMGDSWVLVTACYAKEPKEIDFLPLTVEYKEYQYAAGRIPGGFFKREGRPTEKEILTSRMIDRPVRPLFPEGFNYETQIVGLVLSADGENDPDVLAINGAAAALALNPIPFAHVLGAVRVGRVNGAYVFNPTLKEREVSELDLVVVGSRDAVVMVEAGAKEVSEALLLEAILAGHAAIQKIIAGIEELARRQNVIKAPFTPRPPLPADVVADVRRQWEGPMMEALTHSGKIESYAKIKEVKKYAVELVPEDQGEKRAATKRAISELVETLTRETILKGRRRLDGRVFDQIRPITIEAGILPRTHGSALFTRGETQALVTVTLGTSEDTQLIEDLIEGEYERRFMLHYNFPPFSVGEVKRFGSPGRREIGHGRLAWRSIQAVLPDEKEFPYTIRVVSDILESNGSSSMATICGASLALMDAGVPVSAPVAGVAMGLVKEGDAFAVLTDIAGQEDHYGDMDFKVAGTRKGITALQMDIKVDGISFDIMREALAQAYKGRMHLLECMAEVLPAPRADISPFAPRIYAIQIPKSRIGELIGPGGKNVRAIQEATGVDINIEEDGTVQVASSDSAAAEKALAMIRAQMEEPEAGKIYKGVVKRVEAYGAFVEILPGQDGLLHVSELDWKRVENVDDVVKVGDEIEVKLLEFERGGKLRLSRKALMPKPEGYVERPAREGSDRPPRRDGDRGHGDRDRGPRRDGDRRPPRR